MEEIGAKRVSADNEQQIKESQKSDPVKPIHEGLTIISEK